MKPKGEVSFSVYARSGLYRAAILEIVPRSGFSVAMDLVVNLAKLPPEVREQLMKWALEI